MIAHPEQGRALLALRIYWRVLCPSVGKVFPRPAAVPRAWDCFKAEAPACSLPAGGRCYRWSRFKAAYTAWKKRYWLAADAAGSRVELRTIGLLRSDELIGLLQGMGEVVMEFGGGDFGRIGIGALSGKGGTFSWRSFPNLSSTKLPTSTPWRYLLTESMTLYADIISYNYNTAKH
jgi:hypothetical protein